VDFVNADAMALPFPDDAFDLAVMPLVIFLVPEPAQGVAEMARVVAPGGIVAAYAWDLEGGGFPYQSVNETLGAVGRAIPMPPSVSSSRLEVRSELWATVLGGPSAGQALAVMSEAEVSRFRGLLRERLQTAGSGPITLSGRAHAIRGTVPSLRKKRRRSLTEGPGRESPARTPKARASAATRAGWWCRPARSQPAARLRS